MSETGAIGAEETGGRAAVPRWAWGLGAALAVLVLGGAAAVVAVDAAGNDRGAVRATAERYLDAVAEGDAEAANRLSGPPRGDERLLDSDALGEATRISRAELRGFRVDFERGTASGRVEFRLEGERFEDRIELVRDEGDRWTVVSGLRYPVSYSSSFGDVLEVAGLGGDPIPADSEFVAYAGAYEVRSGSDYLDPIPGAVLRVSPDISYPDAAEWYVPSAEYGREAQRRTAEWYAACAEETSVEALADCGIVVDEPLEALTGRVRAEVEMVEEPSLGDGIETGWATLEDPGAFDVTLRGRGDDGRAVTVETTARAAEADVEILLQDGALEVEIYAY